MISGLKHTASIPPATLDFGTLTHLYTAGDMVYFKILGKSFLVIGSLERAIDIFEKRSTNYSDRPHMIMVMDLYDPPAQLDTLSHSHSHLYRIGWDYNFGLIPYGTWWRRHRRAFHEYFNSTQLPKYLPTQVKHIRAFLRRLLATPDDFLLHSRQ